MTFLLIECVKEIPVWGVKRVREGDESGEVGRNV